MPSLGAAAELLINVTPTESRVALVEHGMLQEVHLERRSRRGIVGNIYRGKVTRVLPGMQAAFVDIGQERAAFLHASDIVSHRKPIDGVEPRHDDIVSLVRQGQDIMVQVVKDPLGTKGARLTTDVTLPSRYLVFMPSTSHVGVSQRVEMSRERDRLKSIVGQFVDLDGGFIIRTAAEGVSELELAQDAAFLRRVWRKVLERRKRPGKGVALLYEEPSLPLRIVRDLVTRNLDRVQIDSADSYQELQEFVGEFMPEICPALELYRGKTPIFDLYDVENEIQRALQRKVDLKSGGYLIIDQTEAMTTIDINTGAFVGHRNLEETIFNTNLEATSAIARQLRLRNLGGIIIIDFIDMISEEHKNRVLHNLELCLGQDRVKTSISGLSQLGLVEMTRKRTRESLEHMLCGECPVCRGTGQLKTVETVCYELYREIIRVDRAYDADEFVAYVSPAVQEILEGDEAHSLADLQVHLGKRVRIKPEPQYAQDKFDVVMM